MQNEAVGYAQGTTYQIKYITEEEQDWQPAFDSIFLEVDRSMSTYREASLINTINRGDTLVEVDSLFKQVLDKSLEIAAETGGAFDPTVGPLVRYYGFDKEERRDIDLSALDSIRAHTGYENIRVEGRKVGLPAGFRLDFNAIAQGFTVDAISRFLEERGVGDYMVEVGGELRARGTNIDDQVWRIGIDKPTEELDRERGFQIIVALKDNSLATSGNYRKFWVDEETGIKYAHTIDPRSGLPARNRLLSISVITPECMEADAYATACMVMGLEDARKFVNQKPGLEAYFISSDDEGNWEVEYTEGFEEYIVQ